jgi:hypothetical protein
VLSKTESEVGRLCRLRRLDTHTLIEECPPPFERAFFEFHKATAGGGVSREKNMRQLMNYKALALGAVLGFVVAVVPSCGTPKAGCNIVSCPTGCCDANAKCVASPANSNNTTCGTAAATCDDCTKKTGTTCKSFACVSSSSVGGGSGGAAGGGAGGGSGGGAAGGGSGGGAAGGGSGGGGGTTACAAGQGPCNGCCSGTLCIVLANTTTTNCGVNGASCNSCASGQLCTAGVCANGAGGGAGGGSGPSGVIGSACSNDSDCSQVAVTSQEAAAGFKAFCKKTLSSGIPYQGGLCTRRCINNSMCGTGLCDYVDGPYGEVDNICIASCSQTVACRTGYKCYQYGATAFACGPTMPDGTDIARADAGPGNIGNLAGGPCTMDSQCPPAVEGFCVQPAAPDGGMPFTGGMCSADCAVAASDTWCGTNGSCNGFIGASDPATGPTVAWECRQACTGDDGGILTPACRTGYACSAAVNGTCNPRCDNPGNGCAAPATCNLTTGVCQ